MTKHLCFLWGMVLLLCLPVDSFAPCVLFGPSNRVLNGTGQLAFIAYNPQTQEVTLIPSIRFTSDAADFGVVIPTPSIPELDTVNRWIFGELEDLTRPVRRWRDRGNGSGCNILSGDFSGIGAGEEADSVVVISQQRVGDFDTVILTADDPMALTDWLDERGYHHSITDNTILQSYIDQKWIFTAMRLNADVLARRGDPDAFMLNFTIDPILLTYTAETLTYPLRLTSISARQGADVTVYTLSSHKMDFPGAEVEYANRITDSERDAIRERYPTVASFIGRQRYLTRLRRTFARTEMGRDFELVRHPNNAEFRRVRYLQVLPFFDNLLLGLLVMVYVASRRIYRLIRRP
ncbi:MAG: DUF2330 domain-containing protein [Candidatus Poribacteria bacterium]|nr:DUF2330 domain-containing protein [Candidatus Poribacteria bacterium]